MRNQIQTSVFLVIIYTVGIIGVLFIDGAKFLELTPLNMFITLMVMFHWKLDKLKDQFKIALILIPLGILIEIIGVKTGLLFGSYEYGSNLGIKIFEVPVIIGVNWCILTFGAQGVLSRFIKSSYLKVFLGALLMVSLDLFIEPLCADLDFWYWEFGAAPFKNYVMWFLASLLMNWIVVKSKLKFKFWFLYPLLLFSFCFSFH